ncbi:MAG: hypothetical protein ACTSRZ_05245 [Promethearchaeota archaeon]
MNSNYAKILEKIRDHLDMLDGKRESLLKETRSAIRMCSEVIKKIQRDDYSNIENMICKVKNAIEDLKEDADLLSREIGKQYIIDLKQEYTEAIIFYNYIKDKKLLSFEEIGVYPYEYIMGLADLVGELKRYILNCIRKNKMREAEEYFGFMEELYDFLISLDYPGGLIQGFRRKMDVCKNIINKTQEIITLSSKISKMP